MLDAVVAGAGLSGLTAAVRLAQAGRRVVVVARGAGSLNLSGATIDVLGYAPERVDSPRAALADLVAGRPEHPYARLPASLVVESLDWFRETVEPLGYTGGLDENLLLPTAVGAAKPTAMASRTMVAGDLRAGPRILVAGFAVLKDFHPSYAADNLRRSGIDARAVSVAASPRPGEADVSGLVIAAAFDESPEFARAVADELAGHVAPGETVGLPAVVGARGTEAWNALRERVGAPVFEIPTLPPSIPGRRVERLLLDALRRAGGRVVVGSQAVGAERTNGTVDALVVQDSARRRPYRATAYVLATGGFATGGLVLDDDGAVREPVLGLPVAGVPEDGRNFARGYLDAHPLSRAGIAVDDRLRPVGDDGEVVARNVHVVGAMLAGAEPWKEKSGDGISLASGFLAAQAVLEEAA